MRCFEVFMGQSRDLFHWHWCNLITEACRLAPMAELWQLDIKSAWEPTKQNKINPPSFIYIALRIKYVHGFHVICLYHSSYLVRIQLPGVPNHDQTQHSINRVYYFLNIGSTAYTHTTDLLFIFSISRCQWLNACYKTVSNKYLWHHW